MIYGYARVSIDAHDLSQLAQLKAAGCEKLFREKITGTTRDRPQLQKLITKLAPGDVVIIRAVDRLSRRLRTGGVRKTRRRSAHDVITLAVKAAGVRVEVEI
jgi:DNA invertase Pin-like site-specific DNA recombinase